jgi:hypothetical protein
MRCFVAMSLLFVATSAYAGDGKQVTIQAVSSVWSCNANRDYRRMDHPLYANRAKHSSSCPI